MVWKRSCCTALHLATRAAPALLTRTLAQFFDLMKFCNESAYGADAAAHFCKYYSSPIIASHKEGACAATVRAGAERGDELCNITNAFMLRRVNGGEQDCPLQLVDHYTVDVYESLYECDAGRVHGAPARVPAKRAADGDAAGPNKHAALASLLEAEQRSVGAAATPPAHFTVELGTPAQMLEAQPVNKARAYSDSTPPLAALPQIAVSTQRTPPELLLLPTDSGSMPDSSAMIDAVAPAANAADTAASPVAPANDQTPLHTTFPDAAVTHACGMTDTGDTVRATEAAAAAGVARVGHTARPSAKAGQMHRNEHQGPCVSSAAAATDVLAAAGAGGAADAAGAASMAGAAGLAAAPPQGTGEQPAAYAALARRSCRSSTAHATAASDSALAQALSITQARAARCGAPGSVAEPFGAPSASGAPELVREEQLAESYGFDYVWLRGYQDTVAQEKVLCEGAEATYQQVARIQQPGADARWCARVGSLRICCSAQCMYPAVCLHTRLRRRRRACSGIADCSDLFDDGLHLCMCSWRCAIKRRDGLHLRAFAVTLHAGHVSNIVRDRLLTTYATFAPEGWVGENTDKSYLREQGLWPRSKVRLNCLAGIVCARPCCLVIAAG